MQQGKRMTKLQFAAYFFMEVVQLGLEATKAVKFTEVPQTLGNIDDGDLERGVGGMGGALLNPAAAPLTQAVSDPCRRCFSTGGA
jgi:hypothetical protein